MFKNTNPSPSSNTVPMFHVDRMLLGDHSVIRPDQFVNGYTALQCITPYEFCCRADDDPFSSMESGHWFRPGSLVPFTSSSFAFFVFRETGRVSLSRSTLYTPESGIYQCQIPGVSGSIETLHIGLYPDGEGELRS